MTITPIERLLLVFTLYTIIAIGGIALYGIIVKPNVIKKIISITIFGDSLNMLAIFLGFQVNSIPPEALLPASQAKDSIIKSVDPLPQALVLTAIVIGLAITLFLIFLSLRAYSLFKTLDMRKIKELKG